MANQQFTKEQLSLFNAFTSDSNGYINYSIYMEMVAREMGYDVERVKPARIIVGNKTFRRNNWSTPEAISSTKDKAYVKSLLGDYMPKDITSPQPNMLIKPRFGTGGVGVIVGDYINVPNTEDFICEEFINGDVYRVLVAEGQVMAVLKKRSAYVIGDGVSTVKELVDKVQYKEPYSYKPKIGYPIHKNIPSKGEKVRLHYLHSRIYGGTVTECTKQAPKAIKELSIKAVNAIPNLKMGGVDIIYDSQNKRAVLLEINSQPHLNAPYFPHKGKAIDVLKKIMEIALEN